jgi:hypothetical protein
MALGWKRHPKGLSDWQMDLALSPSDSLFELTRPSYDHQ